MVFNNMKRVKDLPEFSRPREKLKEKGAAALSDVELIAVILGRGREGMEVMTMASKIARIIAEHKENISIEKLTAVEGIGLAKAAQIMAGFELARRYIIKDRVKINGPESVLPIISSISHKQQEHFVCISLNGANEVIESRTVTVGLLNKTQVHPREVFADVIADRAAAVILAHNHPSGELKPSKNDLLIHEQLTEAGNILGIKVIDHIIISKNGYYSFQEQGFIN